MFAVRSFGAQAPADNGAEPAAGVGKFRRRDHGDHARRQVPHGADTHLPGSTEYRRLDEEA
jgi:hypothetical protein